MNLDVSGPKIDWVYSHWHPPYQHIGFLLGTGVASKYHPNEVS